MSWLPEPSEDEKYDAARRTAVAGRCTVATAMLRQRKCAAAGEGSLAACLARGDVGLALDTAHAVAVARVAAEAAERCVQRFDAWLAKLAAAQRQHMPFAKVAVITVPDCEPVSSRDVEDEAYAVFDAAVRAAIDAFAARFAKLPAPAAR